MITVNKANPTQGEITSSLTGSTGDGSGLHFDGSAGALNFTPADLGTKFSFEFVIKADSYDDPVIKIIDFGVSGNAGRFAFGTASATSYNLGIYDNSNWVSFGVKVLDDLKVHHLTLTVDGTAAVLYDNGNQVATATISAGHNIDATNDAAIAAFYAGSANFFEGTIYRARFYNKTLSSAEVQTAYERADVDFSSQYGSQTSKILNGTSWTGASGSTPPTSWTVGIAGTFTIDSSSGSGAEPALKIARNGSNNNPYIHQNFTAVIGKKYRVKYRVKNIDATSVIVGIGSSAVGEEYNQSTYTSTSWADYEATFTATTTVFSVYVIVSTSTGTQSGYIDSLVVEQVGAVVDMDLAAANPTQSLMVQDRSGAADGTASASGVTQVQPVVQLNATAARIGTSAATPADGVIIADKLGIGTAPSHAATIYGTGAGNATVQIEGEGGADPTINFLTNNTTHWAVGVDDSDSDKFKIVQHSAIGTTNNFFTISSTGNVGIGTPTPTVGNLQIRDATVSTFALTRTTGNTGASLGIIRFGNTDVDSNLANIVGYQDGATDSAAIAFQTQPTGGTTTTRLTIGSNGLATFANGINLGDTTLSNYKEGTFTPTLSKDNFSTTISSPDVATGRYVRVGKMCYIIVYWYKTACPTTTGGSAYKIGALPFSFVQDSPYQFLNAGYVIFNGNSFNTSPYRWQVNDASAVTLYGTQSATNWTSGALEFSACGVLEIA